MNRQNRPPEAIDMPEDLTEVDIHEPQLSYWRIPEGRELDPYEYAIVSWHNRLVGVSFQLWSEQYFHQKASAEVSRLRKMEADHRELAYRLSDVLVRLYDMASDPNLTVTEASVIAMLKPLVD